MTIGIFGLGYVGLTTAACLLKKGCRVIGYEVSEIKRSSLTRGVVPLSEPGVTPVLLEKLATGEFSVRGAMDEDEIPDIVFISVGTPSDEKGGTDLTAVDSVFAELDRFREQLERTKSEVILRSTVPPGTLGAFAAKYPALFERVPMGFYPEFLREGTAIKDFEAPPQTVLGVLSGHVQPQKILSVFDLFGFKYRIVGAISAESLKFACNAYHALKVCFANEIGRLVSSLGGDACEVMELFVSDTQLNISAKYLMPGAPYGGSCLPKDTRSIRNLSVQRGLQLLTIASCEESNQAHFSYIVGKILATGVKSIVLLGLSFKKDTDDIRESPSVDILHRLAAHDRFELRVHDFLVNPDVAVGVNQRLIEKLVTDPGIKFTADLKEALGGAELAIIMHNDKRYLNAVEEFGIPALDVANWRGV